MVKYIHNLDVLFFLDLENLSHKKFNGLDSF